MCQSLRAIPTCMGKQVLALWVNQERNIQSWWLPLAPSSPTKVVGPEFKIKSILPGNHVCWGAGGWCETSENITHWICGLEAIFKYQCSRVFQCWLQFVHTSSNWTCVLLLQAVDIGAGDSSCKDRNKNEFAFGSFCLSGNVISLNSPGCPLPILSSQKRKPWQLSPLLLSH